MRLLQVVIIMRYFINILVVTDADKVFSVAIDVKKVCKLFFFLILLFFREFSPTTPANNLSHLRA